MRRSRMAGKRSARREKRRRDTSPSGIAVSMKGASGHRLRAFKLGGEQVLSGRRWGFFGRGYGFDAGKQVQKTVVALEENAFDAEAGGLPLQVGVGDPGEDESGDCRGEG